MIEPDQFEILWWTNDLTTIRAHDVETSDGSEQTPAVVSFWLQLEDGGRRLVLQGRQVDIPKITNLSRTL